MADKQVRIITIITVIERAKYQVDENTIVVNTEAYLAESFINFAISKCPSVYPHVELQNYFMNFCYI